MTSDQTLADVFTRLRVRPKAMIIGADPGDTTGLFLLVTYDGGMLVRHSQVESFNVSFWLDAVFKMANECTIPFNRRHVAVERYVITKRTVKLARQPAAIEVTGVIRDYARYYGANVWQFGMSDTKKLAPDDLLDRIGWVPKKGRGNRHARDAARQVWRCLMDVDYIHWLDAYENRTDVTMLEPIQLPSILPNPLEDTDE